MILSPRITNESFKVMLTNALSFSSLRRETRTSVIWIMGVTPEPSLGERWLVGGPLDLDGGCLERHASLPQAQAIHPRAPVALFAPNGPRTASPSLRSVRREPLRKLQVAELRTPLNRCRSSGGSRARPCAISRTGNRMPAVDPPIPLRSCCPGEARRAALLHRTEDFERILVSLSTLSRHISPGRVGHRQLRWKRATTAPPPARAAAVRAAAQADGPLVPRRARSPPWFGTARPPPTRPPIAHARAAARAHHRDGRARSARRPPRRR